MEGESGETMLEKNPSDVEEKSHTEDEGSSKPLTHSTPIVVNGGFNTDEFLARININSKINNILRSPSKTPSGVRQRSVFTTTTTVRIAA